MRWWRLVLVSLTPWRAWPWEVFTGHAARRQDVARALPQALGLELPASLPHGQKRGGIVLEGARSQCGSSLQSNRGRGAGEGFRSVHSCPGDWIRARESHPSWDLLQCRQGFEGQFPRYHAGNMEACVEPDGTRRSCEKPPSHLPPIPAGDIAPANGHGYQCPERFFCRRRETDFCEVTFEGFAVQHTLRVGSISPLHDLLCPGSTKSEIPLDPERGQGEGGSTRKS